MAENTKSYEVTLLPSANNAAKATYWRGGRQFAVHETQTLDLTKEELEVYKNDGRFKIENTGNSKEQEQTGEVDSSEVDSPSTAPETTEENSTDKVEDSKDSSDEPEEETTSQDKDVKSSEPEVATDEVVESVGEENTPADEPDTTDQTVASDEVEVLSESQLLKLNRDKVNEYAVSKGLENPQQYETKKEVAEALANATK